MPITPDTKSWTWVLEQPCPECGLDAASLDPVDVAVMVSENGEAWRELLDHPHVRTRPTDDRWSALEYGCHVRDVFRLFDERLRLMLTVDDPLFPNWDQDATALADRYSEQDPSAVAGELVQRAFALSERFSRVAGADWQRTGTRSDGARFTVESFARYLIHDPVHHLHDVAEGYRLLAGA